jgi:signal recognition particle GTPase
MENKSAPAEGEKGKENDGEKKPEEPARPKRNRYQERLSEITAQRRHAEKDASGTRELIREITGEEPPKPSDFKTEDEYRAAMAELRQKLAPYKAMEDKTTRTLSKLDQEYMNTLTDAWSTRVAEVTKEFTDWQAVVSAAKVDLTPELTMAIMESDVGPQIAYHLAKNPDEAHEIASLSPIGQARRIGQLESKILTGGIKPPEVPVSKAKPPVAPVKGDGAKSKPDLGANMSLEEYRRARGLIK